MTEPSTPIPERRVQPIEFLGRTIEVHMPLPEQILVWRRTLDRLQSANPESWTADTVLAALERLRKIVDSLLVDPADIDWLDDQMLAGKVGLKECAAVVTEAVRAFEQPTNREERRAAEKAAKKPARRVAAKKTAGKRVQK